MIVWKERSYHLKSIIRKKLPYTIGGGIGQSRICMFYLRKAHIGEVQASIWPKKVIEEAKRKKSSIVIKQDRLR